MRWLALPSLLLLGSCLASEDPAGFDPDYCPPVSDWDSGWSAFEDEVVSIANARRAEGATCGSQAFDPARALGKNSALRCAARNQSLDMATRGFFDHTNPDGEGPDDRITRAGFEWSAIGENIAEGYPTPAAVMAGWMDSPGHCANIMSPVFELTGVGYYADASGEFWTQTFGTE